MEMSALYGKTRRAAAILIGLVFFFAGLLKIMDPVGAGLIAEEYMKFFRMGFLRFAAMLAGVLMSLAECLAGAALITGVYRKAAALCASALILLFTLLTLALWIFNPAMDCGCFGEAIHLTHGQTLLKNIVLLLLGLYAFLPYTTMPAPRRRRTLSFWTVSASVLCLAGYSLLYIPVSDFTPFNLSSRLRVAVSEDEPEGEYISTYIYEKNGQEGVFTLNRLPDSTWTFVRAEVVRKQEEADRGEYPELPLRDADGNYRDTLAGGNNVFLVSSYRPDKLGGKDWKKIAETLRAAADAGISPLLLVASEPQRFEALEALSEIGTEERMQLLMSAYYSDYKTLISLNRSNGGGSYFDQGYMIDKWAFRSLPGGKTFGRLAYDDATELNIASGTKNRVAFQAFILYIGMALFFL